MKRKAMKRSRPLMANWGRAACPGTAWRKFKDAELSDGKRAAPVLRRIGALYGIEANMDRTLVEPP